jgi:ribosome biogenesis GTPase
MTTIKELGWDDWFEERFGEYRDRGLVPARVTCDMGPNFEVQCDTGTFLANTSGKLRHTAGSRGELPVVGDWVAIQPAAGADQAVIHAVLPRKTGFSRKEAGSRNRRSGGKTVEQVLAANIDTVFIVCAVDGYRNFNVRKMERYVAVAQASGAGPVILLNKIDLLPGYQSCVDEAKAAVPGIPVLPVSAVVGTGIGEVEALLEPGKTVVLLGPSGVGKSALTNALLGNEAQDTGEVRHADGKGRHTTTQRMMFILPGGGILIDTPGMRELALWAVDGVSGSVFDDVEALFERCKFRDCRHENEPGCAVRQALDEGVLDAERWESYQQLQKEAAFVRRRHDLKARLDEKQKWKRISKEIKRLYKDRG